MWRDIKWTVLLVIVTSISCSLFSSEEPTPEIPGKLVYSAPDKNGRYQIYTSLTNGAKRKQLTKFKNDEAFYPSWSNDGSQIAFTTTLRSTSLGSSLYLMNADGTNIRPLKELPDSDLVISGTNPKWSPDDSKITYSWCSNCELGGRNHEVYVYKFKNSSVAQITENPASDIGASWANEYLFFLSNRSYYNSDNRELDNDLYQVNEDGTNLIRITTSGKIGTGIWDPNTETYLIRSKVEPYEWYSVEPLSGDTLEKKVLDIEINISDLRPIKWSKDGQTLMLLMIDFPVQKIRFYDFKEEKLSESFEIENLLGFDWIQNY